ncbi:hypothetical protein DFA_06169 [Cavenderia fasciculata]|uniref:Uncharacterized protein n=1 Tax=Cavenderia fasciculata TaxID=261658 RepID=F4PKA7_CACFS|nr:uncharacterized protein DFA_06169 [Cavenderia fasciculata]EGG24031.1 hypothetical protein DFA_06169 [Cavenderia fasciculata]|eukprot:XP_004361882.1 hypothetical protein DFA_06169 [Cavenderia fasciculata]
MFALQPEQEVLLPLPLDDLVLEMKETLKQLEKEVNNYFDLNTLILDPNQQVVQIVWMAKNKKLCQAMNDQFDLICSLYIFIHSRMYVVYQHNINANRSREETLEKAYTSYSKCDILNSLIMILETLIEFDDTNLDRFARQGADIQYLHLKYTFGLLISKFVIYGYPNRTHNFECLTNILRIMSSIKVNSSSTSLNDLVLRRVTNQLLVHLALDNDDPEAIEMAQVIKPFSGFDISRFISIRHFYAKKLKILSALSASLVCYNRPTWLTPVYYCASEIFLYTMFKGLNLHKNRFVNFLVNLSPIVPFVPLYIMTKKNWKWLATSFVIFVGTCSIGLIDIRLTSKKESKCVDRLRLLDSALFQMSIKQEPVENQ